ncbi:MAG: amidohydrolase family protein [Paracoccus sp. (in: a-proteobacteria)]|uniref:amidohydrolase family protein n=1 Tax=Paracoccus sp. TaxID=267 RepID=UPI002E8458FD|nr:amidohydrolase family protein [Pseudomonadota bacterium]
MILCDCHIHAFEKGVARMGAAYVPPEKDVSNYMTEEARPNGIGRAVIIQASVDGTDNNALLRALNSAPTGIALRGVAMIAPGSPGLEALAAAGIRAARVQDRGRLGLNELAYLPVIAERAAEVDWHVELNTEPERFVAIGDMLHSLPAQQPLVLDHYGHVDPKLMSQQDDLARLLDSGRVWVKLSPTRISRDTDKYGDVEGLTARLVASWPERCLWGSDWPHVMTKPPLPRIADMLDLCRRVLPAALQKQLLQDNPARLYRF